MALLMESICLKGHRGMPSFRHSRLIIWQISYLFWSRKVRSFPVLVGQSNKHHATHHLACHRTEKSLADAEKLFFFARLRPPAPSLTPVSMQTRPCRMGDGYLTSSSFCTIFLSFSLLKILSSRGAGCAPCSMLFFSSSKRFSHTCVMILDHSPLGSHPARQQPPSTAGGSAAAGPRL